MEASMEKVWGLVNGEKIKIAMYPPEPEDTSKCWWIRQMIINYAGYELDCGGQIIYDEIDANFIFHKICQFVNNGNECEWVEEANAWIPKAELTAIAKHLSAREENE